MSVYAKVADRLGDTARGLGRSFERGFRPFDEPGAKVDVNPFGPGEVVTGPAGILRSLTAVAAARRNAANFRQEQEYKKASLYRQSLETKALEQRVNAPRYSFDGVEGLSGPEYLNARNQQIDNERAGAEKPGDYLTPSEADIRTYGVTPDAQGRVPTSVYRALVSGYGTREGVRLRGEHEARVGAQASYQRSFITARTKQLDQRLAEAGNAGWLKVQPKLDEAVRVFSSPGATFEQQSSAAQILGLPTFKTESGAQVFDTSPGSVSAAYARAKQAAITAARDSEWQAQAAERSSYGSILQQGAGFQPPSQFDEFESSILKALDQ